MILGNPVEPVESLEQDALAEEDRKRAAEMGILEDEDTKMQEAMPERAGESDEMNTTI